MPGDLRRADRARSAGTSSTWLLGIPSSSSHALIGGLLGAGTAKAGLSAVVWSGVGQDRRGIVLSPAIGLVLALVLVLIVTWAFAARRRSRSTRTFRRLQLVSASLYSLGHGGNDAQKTMGIIAVLLYSQGRLQRRLPRAVLGGARLPGGDGAGHAARRLAHRSHDGIEDHPADAAPGLLRRDRRRDHAVRGDLARRAGLDHAHHHRRHRRRRRGAAGSAVRWNVAGRIVVAWVVTLPVAGLLGAAFYGLARLADRPW